MWNHWINTVDDNGEVTVPIPGTSLLERIPTIVTDFIIRYPVPVIAVALTFATIAGWKRGGVFKGILIGSVFVIAALFLLRAAS